MNYKKFFAGTALATLMSFLPVHAFSAPMPASTSIEGEDGGFYASVKYRFAYPAFGDFSAKDGDGKELNAFGIKSSAGDSPTVNDYEKYKPNYGLGLKSFAGSIGYSLGGPRVELEGAYTHFDMSKKDKDGNEFTTEANKKIVALTNETTATKLATADNEGVTNISALVNACYDISVTDDNSIVPYVCAGGGLDMVKFLKNKDGKDGMFDNLSMKFAYQAKAGVSYAVNEQMAIFVDGYYHGAVGNEYKERKFDNLTEAGIKDSVTVEQRLGYFGAEAGVRFTF